MPTTNSKTKRLSETVHPSQTAANAGQELPSPTKLREGLNHLLWKRDQNEKRVIQAKKELETLTQYLSVSDQVTEALDQLSQKLFEKVLGSLEKNLTIAIQEVIEQPVRFRAEASFRRGTANVDFSIERSGHTEDVNRGQGGSVQNVLSVGLRMFALATFDPKIHRRFLVLDEQDCWLRPELVPRLVNIVYRAAKELDFQVIMISHHDVDLFEQYADKIYRFTPGPDGVQVGQIKRQPGEPDHPV